MDAVILRANNLTKVLNPRLSATLNLTLHDQNARTKRAIDCRIKNQ